MIMKRDFDTLSEAINTLKKEGYTEDFNLLQESIVCRNRSFEVFAEDFEVDEFYRFEGMSDPGDNSILYAISSKKHDLKGVLVNAYGIYSEDITDTMMKKLAVH